MTRTFLKIRKIPYKRAFLGIFLKNKVIMSIGSIQFLFSCTVACFLINSVHSRSGRILGGRDSKLNEIKYLVAVQSVTALCGGGIIDDKFILTARHCVKIDRNTGTLAKPTVVYAALNNTRNYGEQTIISKVARAFLLKDIQLPYGDIAVLELEKSLDLKNNNEKLQKLELPKSLPHAQATSYPSYDGKIVKFAGFGHSHLEIKDANGQISYVTSTSGPLHVARAKVIDNRTCRKGYGNFIIDSQMCVRIIEDEQLVRSQGVCTGDSGSPIVLDNKIVVGIASFITDSTCNTNIRPSIFTRISSYVEFIENVVKGNKKNMIIIPK